MPTTKRQSLEREEARQELLKILKPGDTVYCILRHVSRSGMQRVIDLQVLTTDANGKPWMRRISTYAARAIGDRYDFNRDGIVVGGCGMDMGFHLTHNLGYVLWPTGYGCIGEGCHSNDHSNGDMDYTPHGTPDGKRIWADNDGTHFENDERQAYGPFITEKVAEAHDRLPRVQHWHQDGGYALRHEWI